MSIICIYLGNLKTFMKGLHSGSGAIQGQDTSISRKVTIISFFKGQAHSLFLALKKMQLEIGTYLERRREFKSAFNLNIVAISEMARGCLAQIGWNHFRRSQRRPYSKENSHANWHGHLWAGYVSFHPTSRAFTSCNLEWLAILSLYIFICLYSLNVRFCS